MLEPLIWWGNIGLPHIYKWWHIFCIAGLEQKVSMPSVVFVLLHILSSDSKAWWATECLIWRSSSLLCFLPHYNITEIFSALTICMIQTALFQKCTLLGRNTQCNCFSFLHQLSVLHINLIWWLNISRLHLHMQFRSGKCY